MTKKTFIKKDFYLELTTQVIELMETHKTGWSKPWKDQLATGFPINVSSNKQYQGVNIMALSMSGARNDFTSNSWGTFKQWQDKGCKVLKGSKSTTICFYKKIVKKDENAVILSRNIFFDFRHYMISS